MSDSVFRGRIDLKEPVKEISVLGYMDTVGRGVEPPTIEPFFLMDDLAYIGRVDVGCFAVKTNAGIVMIDSMHPENVFDTHIAPGLKKLGLENEKILACFISHGHFDHHTGAGLMREKTGCKLIMSKTDAAIMPNPDPRGKVHPYPETIDIFCEDNSEYTFGDKTFTVISTPGHSPGGISIIFPVTDNGKKHTACIWGGTGIPRKVTERCDYLKSAVRFAQACAAKGADVEISAHPFVDDILGHKALLDRRQPGEENPFVIGEKGVAEFMYQRIITAMSAIAESANEMY